MAGCTRATSSASAAARAAGQQQGSELGSARPFCTLLGIGVAAARSSRYAADVAAVLIEGMGVWCPVVVEETCSRLLVSELKASWTWRSLGVPAPTCTSRVPA
jgi:hypothetical protein